MMWSQGALVGAGMGADPGTAVGDRAATTPPPPLDTGIWWPVVAAVGIVASSYSRLSIISPLIERISLLRPLPEPLTAASPLITIRSDSLMRLKAILIGGIATAGIVKWERQCTTTKVLAVLGKSSLLGSPRCLAFIGRKLWLWLSLLLTSLLLLTYPTGRLSLSL